MSEIAKETQADPQVPGQVTGSRAPKPGTVASAITVMAVVVAIMVDRLGVVAGLDRMLEQRVEGWGLDGGLDRMSPWWAWAWLVTMSWATSYQILLVGGLSRRLMLGITVLFLHATWIPVLALCGRVVPLAPAGIGLSWAVICSLIYAARHGESERG